LQPLVPEMLGLPKPGAVLLGKYRVDRVIGVGGMGAVVSARHLQLDEKVAIKLLLPHMLENEEVVQRFLREARAAIKIRSEHCVRVLDVGTLENGAPYMVMEFLEGEDLAAIVSRRAAIAIPDVIDWVLQAAEALAEAHALGIIHRDLKPANLFLTRRADGTPSVKVLDFGISKQTASGADAGVTKTQAVLGSPRYMSPEQMRSTKDVDARADVWALGAVVHELVAGEPPFDADTMTALCAAILQDQPRPMRSARPDVPPALEATVLSALEKDRNRRFQNVAQLAAALAPFGSHLSRTSAERIARVLGVSATAVDPRTAMASAPVWGPAPMAATTGGSGAITSDLGRGPPKGAVAAAIVAGVLLVAGAGTLALVASKRHPSPATAPPPSVEGLPVVASPAPPPPSAQVLALEPGGAPTAVPSAPPSASAATVDSSSPAGSAAAPRPAPGPAGAPLRRVPAVAPTKPAGPSNNNPFGDDRHG
jgi:tRNA A-37 threonylcarbamoyl transferase component Bud32